MYIHKTNMQTSYKQKYLSQAGPKHKIPVAKEPYKVSVCVSVCVSLHITGLHALSLSAFTCIGTHITKIFKTAKVKIDSQVYASLA